VSFVSSTELQAVAPPGAAGTIAVRVQSAAPQLVVSNVWSAPRKDPKSLSATARYCRIRRQPAQRRAERVDLVVEGRPLRRTPRLGIARCF
jgi:hypothetical protein